MDAFSLLNYWRNNGGGGRGAAGGDSSRASTTIVTAVAPHADDDDDGPFFDLEFAVPDDEEEEDEDNKDPKGSVGADSEEEKDGDEESSSDDDDGGDGDGEFKFTLSSASSNDRVFSPSDDLFFKGRLVPVESSTSIALNGSSDPNSKFRGSLLKSATKFRVFMLGFKKSKLNPTEKPEPINGFTASPTLQEAQNQEEKDEETKQSKLFTVKDEETKQSKLFTVKLKVEEVPIVSLFTRENSKSAKSQHKHSAAAATDGCSFEAAAAADEKRFSKDVMNKYLKKVKPLYVRVSKRYAEKLRFSGQLTKTAVPPPSTAAQQSSPGKSTVAEKTQAETENVESPAGNAKGLKQGNFPAGLRVVCKHLGKSRSASAVVATAAPPGPASSRRRDDSLLQQQDGIQSAILHCKRSFNASRDSESSLLSRSVSDPSHEKSMEFSGKNSEEGKTSCL